MAKFKEGDHIRNIYNGQRFLVIEVNTNTSSDGYYIIKGETYPHKDKKWMLFFDAENEWRLIGNNNPYESKVMTQEEKAKAYDEVREKIALRFGSNVAEEIFSKFEESEDEKVKKWLIAQLKIKIGDNATLNNMIYKAIAWLEKQGEQEEPQVYETEDGEIITYSETDGYKVIEPIESKFKVGEWITNGDYTWKIVEVKPLDYILQSQDGNIVDDTISHVDEQFHSFTVQDAKDGDVLVDVYGNIGIFEKRYGINWHTYCYLGYDGLFLSEGGSHGSICYLATKEQRDFLFRKMKEKGYEWDAEKKELKKIHVIDEGKDEMDYCFTKMMNGENVSSTWSEEDEKFFKTALWHISYSISNGESTDIHCDTTEWLKSLKERYIWKPSDEQINALEQFVRSIGESGYASPYDNNTKLLYSLLEQLKKLKGD